MPSTTASTKKTQRGKKRKKVSTTTTATSEAVRTGASFVLTQKHFIDAIKTVKEHAPMYHDHWFSSNDWAKILRECDTVLRSAEEDEITSRKVVSAFSHAAFGGQSTMIEYNKKGMGIYADRYGTSKEWHYMITTRDKCFNPPQTNFLDVTKLSNLKTADNNANSSTTTTTPPAVPYVPPKPVTEGNNTPPQTHTPTQPPSENVAAVSLSFDKSPNDTQNQQTKQPEQKKLRSEELRNQTYWHSEEAFELFMPKGLDSEDYEESTRDRVVISAIHNRIKESERGIHEWWEVVENGKEKDDITWCEKLAIKIKCQYLKLALEEALKHMGSSSSRKKWKDDCCQTLVDIMSRIMIVQASHKQTVMHLWW